MRFSKGGFTLIELLIVLGILAITATIVVLAINPSELLAQTRDGKRLAELANLNKAISVVTAEESGVNLGNPTKIYLSLPDDFSSACATHVDLPPLPPGYSYNCATTADLRKVNGSGWVPVNFRISSGAPLPALPVDPLNSAASGYYYAYVAGSKYAVVTLLESEKYLKQAAVKDGGTDDGRAEFGTDIMLWAPASGLRGLWRLDETTGATLVTDSSGSMNNGTILPSNPVSFVSGKLGNAANFLGSANGGDISISDSSSLFNSSTTSILAWVRRTDANMWAIFGDYWNTIPAKAEAYVMVNGNQSAASVQFYTNNAGNAVSPQTIFFPLTFALNNWEYLALTWVRGNLNLYVGGSFVTQQALPAIPNALGSNNYHIGYQPGLGSFKGQIDEVRFYSRSLTAAEIRATYKATR